MIKYKKRNCNIEFNLIFTEYEGSQSCDFSINGDTYSFWLSYAMGELFGRFLACVYGLCIEVLDNRENTTTKYKHDDPENENVITGIIASACWDGERPTLEWTLSRELYNNPDNIIDITLNFDFETKICRYKVKIEDLCYAVAKAVTNILKNSGFCGYQYSAEYDSINIVHFLVVKNIGLTGKISNLCTIDQELQLPVSSLEEELELILFEM